MSNLKEVSEELGVVTPIRGIGGYFGNNGNFTYIENQKKNRASRRSSDRWKVINADKVPTYEFIAIGDIIALQTQRVVKDDWAVKVLNLRGGIDMTTFGALSVRYSKKKGKYQCFDGNGRMLLVEAMREELGKDFKLPCLVYNNISEKDAMDLFNYIQKTGRRTLQADTLFINEFHSEHYPDATKMGEVLKETGLYIQGETMQAAPYKTPKINTNEIRINSVKGARLFALGRGYSEEEASAILKVATKLIVNNFGEDFIAGKKTPTINQKIFYGISGVLASYPEMMTDVKLRDGFEDYLNVVAGGKTIVSYLSDLNDLVAPATGASQIIPYLSYRILQDFDKYPRLIPYGYKQKTEHVVKGMKRNLELAMNKPKK
jgi:hypothetical protein